MTWIIKFSPSHSYYVLQKYYPKLQVQIKSILPYVGIKGKDK